MQTSNSFLNLYCYQDRLFNQIEENRLIIFSKFKGGGFTTLFCAYILWKCLFEMDQHILWLVPCEKVGYDLSVTVKHMLMKLPSWIKGNVMKMSSDFQKTFPDTGSDIYFGKMSECRYVKSNLLIIEDVVCFDDFESLWNIYYANLNDVGNCIIDSSVTDDNCWFWKFLTSAKKRDNKFKAFTCSYDENPEFQKKEWQEKTKAENGMKFWQTEICQNPINLLEEKRRRNITYRSIMDDWEVSSYL